MNEPIAIAGNRRRLNVQIVIDSDAFIFNQLTGAGNGVLYDFLNIGGSDNPVHLGGFDFLIIEHLVDQAGQAFAFLDDDPGKARVLICIDVRIAV